jgi:D-sedoheptulose 7-phosphate isomerase
MAEFPGETSMTLDAASVRRRASERLGDLAAAARRAAEELPDAIAVAAALVHDTLRGGGTLYFCGNGGSAADAQHLATEYVVRYLRDRRALPAVALTTDSSLLTAAGNDLGFDQVFARQVEAFVGERDLLIVHSTSGNSPNVLRAAEVARARGTRVLALIARDGGALRALATHSVVVPVDRTDRAQELHLCIQHLICEIVEEHV